MKQVHFHETQQIWKTEVCVQTSPACSLTSNGLWLQMRNDILQFVLKNVYLPPLSAQFFAATISENTKQHSLFSHVSHHLFRSERIAFTTSQHFEGIETQKVKKLCTAQMKPFSTGTTEILFALKVCWAQVKTECRKRTVQEQIWLKSMEIDSMQIVSVEIDSVEWISFGAEGMNRWK